MKIIFLLSSIQKFSAKNHYQRQVFRQYISIDFDSDLFTFDVTSVICTTSQGLKHGIRLRYRYKDKIGVCKKKNRSWVFSGERKIPTLGSTVPVGNSASLVSHWNGWTLGLGFSYLHWTPMMDSIYLHRRK